MAETVWSLVPPIITIALALITKEVYMSLIIGIFVGAMMFTGFDLLASIDTMFSIMSSSVGGNVYILVFLVLLGIVVAAIARSGASRAYGEWAARVIKGKRSSLLVTALLGVVIFIDDYFNCLTVGTVMRPVTDKFNVTRAKLAYIIDATAAPICIIAPVSSWAAAVSSSLPESSNIDGFALFLQTIPVNLYAWFTILFMLFLIITGKDFATMAALERKSGGKLVIPDEYKDDDGMSIVGNGKILDLLLPLIVLIGGCIFGMLYTGGILDGASVSDAFANCESARGLVIGSFIALVFIFLLYVPRGVLRFGKFCECFNQGFRAMTPAIFILCLAWSLSGVCGEEYLNIGGYVGGIVSNNATVGMFMPAIFFIVALGLGFATGTSWGTFGILIPIALAVVPNDPQLLVVTVAAVLAGAVGGDHVSPISDTTILASAGAQCHHLDHVNTQIPYVIVVASCSFIGYLAAGIADSGTVGFGVGLVVLLCSMGYIYKFLMKA
ncbi:MAG TPA: Na+/H+ antiporter NhaC family protein [Megamonas hypermegale]|uniref:Na+/H+ antiporter NhaC family protein n=1 Tax=Megamonas hypermegale TaxID=158847 RepID=A0A921HLA7_9FIRM|nr:Na+/H+ antiporter NhaC family protein [Megamonas hypermegale]MDM8142646.1 Na+/H+ antiporter NhaC family protein [Megamonas hypermegale]HJF84532.1 Na+/H+ antiporter NhaC family protein [Megamonas hypermegale]